MRLAIRVRNVFISYNLCVGDDVLICMLAFDGYVAVHVKGW